MVGGIDGPGFDGPERMVVGLADSERRLVVGLDGPDFQRRLVVGHADLGRGMVGPPRAGRVRPAGGQGPAEAAEGRQGGATAAAAAAAAGGQGLGAAGLGRMAAPRVGDVVVRRLVSPAQGRRQAVSVHGPPVPQADGRAVGHAERGPDAFAPARGRHEGAHRRSHGESHGQPLRRSDVLAHHEGADVQPDRAGERRPVPGGERRAVPGAQQAGRGLRLPLLGRAGGQGRGAPRLRPGGPRLRRPAGPGRVRRLPPLVHNRRRRDAVRLRLHRELQRVQGPHGRAPGRPRGGHGGQRVGARDRVPGSRRVRPGVHPRVQPGVPRRRRAGEQPRHAQPPHRRPGLRLHDREQRHGTAMPRHDRQHGRLHARTGPPVGGDGGGRRARLHADPARGRFRLGVRVERERRARAGTGRRLGRRPDEAPGPGGRGGGPRRADLRGLPRQGGGGVRDGEQPLRADVREHGGGAVHVADGDRRRPRRRPGPDGHGRPRVDLLPHDERQGHGLRPERRGPARRRHPRGLERARQGDTPE
mmetsp:Transcript_33962/g.81300  ORF Transcript_33962/g.81300 Transcript_33962/m.81300 type:complete len:530 (+) Transcript_33962:1755-3344(+)